MFILINDFDNSYITYDKLKRQYYLTQNKSESHHFTKNEVGEFYLEEL
jgi:hypothetical protein